MKLQNLENKDMRSKQKQFFDESVDRLLHICTLILNK